MSNIRLVTPADSEPSTFAEISRANLERVLAKGPVNLVIAYETADELYYETTLPSDSAAWGLVDKLRAKMMDEDAGGEE